MRLLSEQTLTPVADYKFVISTNVLVDRFWKCATVPTTKALIAI